MSFNIMDLVQDQLGDQIKGQIGNLLGDQSSLTDTGLSAAVPALLNGFTERASAPGGADVLFDAVSKHDDGMLDNIGSMLGGGQSSSLIETGTKLLSGLFGNSGLGSLAGVLAGVTGLSKGNTGSLLGIIAPIVIGVIKRKVLGGGLNAAGLLDMLKGQQSNINAAMPMGLSDQLNSSGFLSSISDAASGAVSSATGAVSDAADGVRNVASDAANTVTDVGRETAAGGSSLFKKLIPIIGLALIAWLGWNFLSGSGKDAADDAANAVGDAATTATEAASDAAATATETASEAASAVADAVDIDGLTGDLNGMFDSAKSSLEGITDAASAEAAVPQLTEMGEKLGGISDLMGKVPEDALGPLTGIVSSGIAALEPLLETIRAIPGVGDIVDPIITPIMEKLQALAG